MAHYAHDNGPYLNHHSSLACIP